MSLHQNSWKGAERFQLCWSRWVSQFYTFQIDLGIFLALATYFFTLTSFGWMTIMSYNIMSQFRLLYKFIPKYSFIIWFLFRGNKLPPGFNNRRLVIYSIFSVGLPLLMTILMLILQQSDKSKPLDGETLEDNDWRPGFAEVSCWFTHCSNGLVYFFYL